MNSSSPIAALLIFGITACSQHGGTRSAEPPQSHLSERIDVVASTALREGPIAGLSIAVTRGGDVVHARDYGVSGLDPSAGAEGLYDLASVTKLLVAAAVLTLVDAGQLDLQDDLASLLPEFPNIEQARTIKLRHLLNHTSGLSDYVDAEIERWNQTQEPLRPEFVLDYARARPLDFEPGTNWRYTNTGFYLAGLIIERTSGRSWSEYTLEAVARPLGLQGIVLCDDLGAEPPPGFEVTGTQLAPSREAAEEGVGADGGLCGCALDMARLPRALSSSGLLSATSLAAMLRPTVLTSGLSVGYGLGVALGSLEGNSLWGHLGGNGASYISTLAHYPDQDVTIAVLVNTLYGEVGALQVEASVARLVLGFDEPTLSDDALTSSEQAAHVGRYVGDRGPRSFTIAAHGDRIVRRTPTDPDTSLPLLRQRSDVFGREDWPLDRLVFHRRGGLSAAVSLYYNGFFDGFYLRSDP